MAQKGSNYRGSDKPSDRRAGGSRDGGKKPYPRAGEGRDGDKRGYTGPKPQGTGTGYAPKKSYGDKQSDNTHGTATGYAPKRNYGDKQGDKPQGTGTGYAPKRSYGDKQSDNTHGTGTGYAPKKSYGDKQSDKPHGTATGYVPKKSYGDRRADAERKPPLERPAPVQPADEDTLPFLIIGRNAVKEAIKSGRSIDYIVAQREPDGSLKEILGLARDRKLVIRESDRKKLDELCLPFGHGGRPANHQGIVAYAAGVDYCTVGDILAYAKQRGGDPFVIVLDGITDPHNLGSIIRSAECAGAHGVVIGKRRSASVTAAAVKAAAGATEHIKIARVTNINVALGELKKAGLWIAGADMTGTPMDKQGLNGPLAFVIGGEGAGLTKLVREGCDFLVSIPLFGRIESLNAAVAAAVLMFEKKRQDAVT